MDFIIRNDDWPLINAAIKFGEWLRKQDIDNEQKGKIDNLINALKILPKPTIGLDAVYGLHILEKYPKGIDIDRSWYVCMYPAEWAECVLEIGSTYSPNPRLDDIFDKIDNELNFMLNNDGKVFTHDYNFDRWINEVSNPDVYKTTAIEYEIDIN